MVASLPGKTDSLEFVVRLLCAETVDRRVLQEEADLLAVAMGLALR
jgi:hypothetical protein